MLFPYMPAIIPFLITEIDTNLKCAGQLIEMLNGIHLQYKKATLKRSQTEKDKEEQFEMQRGIFLFQSYLRKVESIAPYVIHRSNKVKEQAYQQQTIIPDQIIDSLGLLHVQY